MTDVVIAVVAVLSLFLSTLVFYRDTKRGKRTSTLVQETADLQRRMVEIEEERQAWKHEERESDRAAIRLAEERARSADLRIRFSFRNSDHSIGRVIARNEGQADATGVTLEVWGERDGERHEMSTYGGADDHRASRLQTGESVHYDALFTLSSPQATDLRYRITWTDGLGDQQQKGRVPAA